jgi:hypothetical protein
MSLKAFHVIFIAASNALALGFGIWELKAYFSGEGSGLDLGLGLGSFAVAAALLVYGRYFLKKLKHVGYL